MRPKRKILIIKTGYTETLTNEPYKEGNVSLGDVLRTTAILNLYKQDSVTWLTDSKAVELLEYNPYIDRILEFNHSSILQLENEYYDIVINLEKNPGICALAAKINSWQKYGFRFDPVIGCAHAYNGAVNALYLAQDARLKKKGTRHWLEMLFEIVGQPWANEGYILAKPVKYEQTIKTLALNNRTGGKFKGKSWPADSWEKFSRELQLNYVEHDWQPEQTTLRDYIEWIDRHYLIVTCDSLGLHLAMALDKYVVGLFGPTPSHEIHPYEKGIMLQARKLEDISVKRVCDATKELLRRD